MHLIRLSHVSQCAVIQDFLLLYFLKILISFFKFLVQLNTVIFAGTGSDFYENSFLFETLACSFMF